MEDTFEAITLWLASGTEAAAAPIIGLASVEGKLRAPILFVPGTGSPGESADRRKEDVRPRLGRWPAVALEFEMAAGPGTHAAILRGRLVVADGVISALGHKTAATLLKTVEPQTWTAHRQVRRHPDPPHPQQDCVGLPTQSCLASSRDRSSVKRVLLREEARLNGIARE